jgi:hypothetical protein
MAESRRGSFNDLRLVVQAGRACMIVIDDGPWGTKWKLTTDPISETNLACFTCKFCGTVSMGMDPVMHKKDCKHPNAGRH